MSPDQLLAAVRADVVRELEGFDLSRLVLRLSDGPDRSVLVIARLGGGEGAMVTRVYEADLRRRSTLTPTYLSDEDVDQLVDTLSCEGARTLAIPGARPGADP